MAKKIDLQPIQEEHVSTLCAFLNSMDISSSFDVKRDSVQEDMRDRVGRGAVGANIRSRYIKLEGMNIDGIRYRLYQTTQSGQYGTWMSDKWKAECRYWVKRYIGGEKKKLADLQATIKKKKKGLFKKEIVDFTWVGGRIADVLNMDTSLKEPLLAHLVTAQTVGNDVDIRIEPLRPPSKEKVKDRVEVHRKAGVDVDFAKNTIEDASESMMRVGQGVWINSCATNGDKKKTTPLLLPSKDAFKAYDRIAKHIRDYAIL